MLATGFHSRGRNGPDFLFEIDFVPATTYNLAGSQGAQYSQFNRD